MRAGNLSDSYVDDKFSLLKTSERGDLAVMIVGYLLGGILLVLCGWLIWEYHKAKYDEIPEERIELMASNRQEQ